MKVKALKVQLGWGTFLLVPQDQAQIALNLLSKSVLATTEWSEATGSVLQSRDGNYEMEFGEFNVMSKEDIAAVKEAAAKEQSDGEADDEQA